MTMKIKALGVGLLAVVATSALAVMNAGATVGGHFVIGASHATILGYEEATHVLELAEEGSTQPDQRIYCTTANYSGTVTSATVEEITLTPKWSECHTTNHVQNFEVHENGCSIRLTVRPGGDVSHNTVHLICPAGKSIEVTHPHCNITFAPQTASGVVYTRLTDVVGDMITLESTVKGVESQYHGGVCVFLGTNHKSEITGSVTIEAVNAVGQSVNLTAT